MQKTINTSNNLVETALVSTKKSKANASSIKKEEILMRKLVEFYSYSTNLEQLLAILLKKSKISLRVLDFFVTNYTKDFNVTYNISHLGRVKRFCVYDSYKAQLKAFHKKLFDPFCRRRRIYFEYCDGCEIETTVAQLNFFKWAIQNRVLDYVEAHMERIGTYMAIKVKELSNDSPSVKISGEISRQNDNTITAKIDFTNK